MKSKNLAIKDIENLFHPATNLVVHEDSDPLILNKGEGIYVYDVDGNYKIAGSSFADSNGYDSISYLPKNHFQKITPIPFETNYYKVVSNYSSSCSFLSYDNLTIDNFSLEGFG